MFFISQLKLLAQEVSYNSVTSTFIVCALEVSSSTVKSYMLNIAPGLASKVFVAVSCDLTNQATGPTLNQIATEHR